jgi:translocation and assembly module TamA
MRTCPASRRTSGLVAALAALGAALAPCAAGAADPQPYAVTIAPTGNAALDQAAHDASTLISLQTSAPVGPFGLIGRTRDDVERLIDAMDSFGYYDGRVQAVVAGEPLASLGLPSRLEAMPVGSTAQVTLTMTPGPPFHLRQITLHGTVPEAQRTALGLTTGQPARAADVLAARDRLLKALRDAGYALARVGDPVATLVPAEHGLDVAFTVETGPRVDLGPITVSGLRNMNEAFVRQRLLLHQGEQYSPQRIDAAQQDLSSLGVFSGVRIVPADQTDASGQLPVTMQLTEQKLHSVTLSAAYSTDLGGTVSATWMDRNLFGNAERLTLGAALNNLGGTDVTQPGYNINAALVFPDWLARDQSLGFNALAVREYLEAYDRTAAIIGATVTRKLDANWSASVGVTGEQARIEQQGLSNDYTLLQLPLSLQYDSAHDLFDPTHGIKASALVTPTYSLLVPTNAFVIAQVSGSTYLDIGAFAGARPGRSILALHGLVGTVNGASTFGVPPDQRLYAGGSGTVRGFRYQSIGPQFPNGDPIGGTSVDAGSIEFRQRFGESYGAVAFVDAGQVGSNGVPFEGIPRVGVGVGARYYTSFGPLRLDVAIPVNREPHGDAFEAYIGIGQAF